MPKKDFDKATRDAFAKVEEQIAAHPEAQSILKNLRRAYERNTGEQVRALFSQIRLPLGRAERTAMGAANIPAHGGMTTGGNLKELVRHGRAYRTLFARTFLRLLAYDGPYVDYTTPSFPARPLEEPSGGAAS